MPTQVANASTDAGLGRFLNAVTFISRLAVLNAGLVGVFNWNLVDPLLGREPGDPANVTSRTLYIAFGLLSVVVLCLLSKWQQPSAPSVAIDGAHTSFETQTTLQVAPSTINPRSTWSGPALTSLRPSTPPASVTSSTHLAYSSTKLPS